MSKKNNCCKKTSIGGQALMEGIMMRGPVTTAMAVRNTKGEIVIEKFPTVTKKRSKIFTLPIIRGVVAYIDSMTVGTKCLTRSAEISGLEEAEEELRLEKEAKKAAKAAKKAEKASKKSASNDDANVEAVEAKVEIAENQIHEEVETTVESDNATLTEDAVVAEPVAEKASSEAQALEANDNSASSAKKNETKKKDKKKGSILDGLMPVITICAMVLAIFLFVFVPASLFGVAKGVSFFSFLHNDNPIIQSIIKSAFESTFRVLILVGYMSAMLLMKEIRRTFRFHGAEHKTIFCYEAGLELTVENVKKQKKQHPRCGTSFLILMVLVSFFFSLFIDPIFYLVFQAETPLIVRTLIKILMLPIICGTGYELIKLAGKYDNWITKLISLPGIWFQHITVLEPSDDMIECAIAAMKEVIPEDQSDVI